MSITRYDLNWDYYDYVMEKDDTGEYVKYEDHVAEAAKFEKAIKTQQVANIKRVQGLKAHIEELQEKNRVLTEALNKIPTEIM